MKKRLFLAAVLILISIVALVIFTMQRTPNDAPEAGNTAASFPIMEGTNLLFEKVAVPDVLDGELKLIVVAYDTDQQPAVNEWLIPLEALNTRYPELRGYYIPILPQDASDAALFILGGMTVAANSDQDRARTIVVFTDVVQFNQLVNVPDVSQVQLFLLDSENTIRWHGTGNYSENTLAELENALQELIRE